MARMAAAMVVVHPLLPLLPLLMLLMLLLEVVPMEMRGKRLRGMRECELRMVPTCRLLVS